MEMKILVADDSLTMRKIIINTLTTLGIDYDSIIEAEDGQDALGKVKENRFDLILTDWNMPHMDGLTLVKNLRQLPHTKNTPIVMVTTEGSKECIVTALKQGVNNYIVKPFDASTLKNKISGFMNI